MKWTNRRLGLAVLMAGVVFGGVPKVQGQPGLQEPAGLPKLTEIPPPPLPAVNPPITLPGEAETPKGQPLAEPSLPATSGASPVAAPPGGVPPATTSLKDIILNAADGPSPSNPTGRQEPGVSLQWICPPSARLGQPVTCNLVVKSLSANRLHQVKISYRPPTGVTVRATEPQATAEGDILTWQLETLEPRQEKRLDIHLLPTAKGNFACHAFVTFTGTSTATFAVREPKLVVLASAPKKAIAGDPASFVVTVSNPGDAPAEHVTVKATLSEGLEHASGRIVEFNLENLGPNEGRTVLVNCVAKGLGQQVCSAVATAEADKLTAEASAGVEVVAPKVNIVVSGPGMRYLDRHAVYNFKVTNPGTATANHVMLTDYVPPGFKVATASEGGRHDFVSRTVVWFLGDLEPGQSKDLSLDLVAINPGEYWNKAMVTAARGLRSEADVATRVEGLPGLLMELVDVEDPVEVGKENSFEVRVVNTGTKTETNLQLTCYVPEKMEFLAAKAPSGCTSKVEGREVIFSPLPRLAPRADLIYRVKVRCLAPGDLRFQARVNADGLERPVLREESTRVYGDEREGLVLPQKK